MGRQQQHTDGSIPIAAYTPVAQVVDGGDLPQAQPLLTTKTTGLHSTSSQYADLPEAQGLLWEDDFFDTDDDIVAVFDFDYENMETYYSNVNWCLLGLSALYTPIFMACMFGLAPCYLKRNVEWSVRAKHVAVTRDGIRFVQDRRKACWGLPCTDQGKCSKTVPFDKITDCDLHEPAGNTCCVVPNILTTVKIDTASSGDKRAELVISGLKDAERFKKLVWAMKRKRAPSTLQMVGRGDNNDESGSDVASLLREIRDELRQNNNLLVTLKHQNDNDDPQPSAPPQGEEADLNLPTLT